MNNITFINGSAGSGKTTLVRDRLRKRTTKKQKTIVFAEEKEEYPSKTDRWSVIDTNSKMDIFSLHYVPSELPFSRYLTIHIRHIINFFKELIQDDLVLHQIEKSLCSLYAAKGITFTTPPSQRKNYFSYEEMEELVQQHFQID